MEIEAWAAANLVHKVEEGRLAPGPVYQDLKRFPFEELARPRDFDLVLSGGFPCQPFSCAGKGTADDDPRHLFPHIKSGIERCEPDLVVLENVEGILSRKLKSDWGDDPAGTPVALHVLRELERLGYRATARLVSASEVPAEDGDGEPRAVPHQRKRVFFVAQPAGVSGERWLGDTFIPRPQGGIFAGSDDTFGREDEGGRPAPTTSGLRPHHWRQVCFAAEQCDVDPDTGELHDLCRDCGSDYADSPCPGPTQDGFEYVEHDGLLYARRLFSAVARPGEPQHGWEEPRVV